MISKVYTANSKLAINVKIGEGYKHISFDPTSGGKSTYISNDVEEQNALEAHGYYGGIFRCTSVTDTDKVEEKKEEEKKEETKVFEVEVTDLESAKEYLCEHFDLLRTKLRTRKAILEQATAHNIKFVGLD